MTLELELGDEITYRGPTADGSGQLHGQFVVQELGETVTLRDARWPERFPETDPELYTYQVTREQLEPPAPPTEETPA